MIFEKIKNVNFVLLLFVIDGMGRLFEECSLKQICVSVIDLIWVLFRPILQTCLNEL